MHSQAMRYGDMYSVTRASFLHHYLKPVYYDDVAPLSHQR